jgi:hypothetical protein
MLYNLYEQLTKNSEFINNIIRQNNIIIKKFKVFKTQLKILLEMYNNINEEFKYYYDIKTHIRTNTTNTFIYLYKFYSKKIKIEIINNIYNIFYIENYIKFLFIKYTNYEIIIYKNNDDNLLTFAENYYYYCNNIKLYIDEYYNTSQIIENYKLKIYNASILVNTK